MGETAHQLAGSELGDAEGARESGEGQPPVFGFSNAGNAALGT